MRVGVISPYSLTLPGGVQAQILGLARALLRAGVDVRVLGPCDGAPPAPFVTPLGNSLPTAANGSMAPIAPDPPAQLRTIRALRDEAFDVLHLHEPLAPGPTVTTLTLDVIPAIGTFHAAGGSAGYDRLSGPVRWLAGRLTHRVAVSEQAKQMAQSALGGEYEILFNGVEIERFADAKPWPTDGPTILFLGRHEPRKGLDVLLQAMASLPSDVQLWIGGEGPETARLRARSAGDPRIHWLGRLDDAEKRGRLRGADVFCAPSLHGESFGVVLLEAMAAGTPVVASDLAGYSLVTRSGTDALLVEAGDVDALADGIHRVLDDDKLAARYLEAGAGRVDAFSMARLADRYASIYERIAASTAPRGRRNRGLGLWRRLLD